MSGGGDLEARVRALGRWFHNIDLGGVWTAPDHFLGDYPGTVWRSISDAIPRDLSGKSVLDIGCNGGFFSIEMKRRGAARVVGLDHDPRYLAQARLAVEVTGLDVELRQLSVYDVAALETNWWIPNRACAEAMLRSAGFSPAPIPGTEVYLCRVAEPDPQAGPVHPARPPASGGAP